ncbi:hypothetical protein TSOC_012976 [Tetrabaena socialis]|uniref:Uncharacterized protein n=1 Tax=Tetrabaena socialis TaxID=47790 RepID=A0A2J7ZLK0_9CHLO|nr:hypothetical protein TSOC_012976 [Tetrabaena socialis]|eukprot:PNH01149.1 hypothetical protein TSOC_012976 [Tetrabaena socialis]
MSGDVVDQGPHRGQLAAPGPGQDPADAASNICNFVRDHVELLQLHNVAVPAQPAHNEPLANWKAWALAVLALSHVCGDNETQRRRRRDDEETERRRRRDDEETERRRRRDDEETQLRQRRDHVVLHQLVEFAQRPQPVWSSGSSVSHAALHLGFTNAPLTASDNSLGSAAAAGSASGPGAGPSGSGAGASSATRPQEAAEDDSAAAGAAVAGTAAGAEAAGTLQRVRDPPTQGMGPLAVGADPERTGRGRTPVAGLGAGAASGSPRCGCRAPACRGPPSWDHRSRRWATRGAWARGRYRMGSGSLPVCWAAAAAMRRRRTAVAKTSEFSHQWACCVGGAAKPGTAGMADGLPTGVAVVALRDAVALPTLTLPEQLQRPPLPLGGGDDDDDESLIACALLKRHPGSALAVALTTVLAGVAEDQEDADQPLCGDVWRDVPVLVALSAGCGVPGGDVAARRVARRAAHYRWEGVQLLRAMPGGRSRVCPPPDAQWQLVEAMHGRQGASPLPTK